MLGFGVGRENLWPGIVGVVSGSSYGVWHEFDRPDRPVTVTRQPWFGPAGLGWPG
jgi:hypothetical protein